jgi:single-strand DNA-binding protein
MNTTITLVGNLTRQPELRTTAKGVLVANLGMAVNRRWRDAGGESQESTSFFNVVAWGSLAEHCALSLERGDLVVVQGRLEQRSWTTDTGDRRSTVEVIADDIGPSLRWVAASLSRSERATLVDAA